MSKSKFRLVVCSGIATACLQGSFASSMPTIQNHHGMAMLNTAWAQFEKEPRITCLKEGCGIPATPPTGVH